MSTSNVTFPKTNLAPSASTSSKRLTDSNTSNVAIRSFVCFPTRANVVQSSKTGVFGWRVSHSHDFIQVKSTVAPRPVTSTALIWNDEDLKESKAAHVIFTDKTAELVERLMATPLDFFADCALRSARCSFEFPWCQWTRYWNLTPILEKILVRFEAGEDLKSLIVSHEIFSWVQYIHEHITLTKWPFSSPESIPWRLSASRLPRSGYQFEYRFDAIAAPSSDLRPDLISKILDWLYAPSSQVPVLLITGDGGVGKSTLLRTVCRQFDDAYRLHASFFFDSKHGSSDMARQLFKNVAPDLSRWDWIDRHNHWHMNFLKPCLTIPGNTLVVIDALDECEGPRRRELVAKLAKAIPRLPHNYRLLITSRDEDNLLEHLLSLPTQHLTLLDMNEVIEEGGLLTAPLANTFGNLPWLKEVVAKSNGLPRFATTA